MSGIDRDAWSCPHPDCGETVRGTSSKRRAAQRTHARRHPAPPAEAPGSPAGARAARALPPIPAAPTTGRRRR